MIAVFNSPLDFDGYFNLSRRAGQTLLSFVTEHDELNRRLEKHNVTLPDAVQGWHLLRKANLTREQKQLITLHAPQLEKKKVIEAMYLVLGQDFKAGGHHHGADRRGFHGHRSFKQRGYVAQDEDALEYEYDDGEWSVDYGDGAYYEWDDDESYAAGEPWPVEEDFDSQAAYFQTETVVTEENYPWQDVDSYDAVYAAYLDARKRFSDLKLSRGYLPIVALSDPAAGNLSPGVSQSPVSSPSSKGKKGRHSKGWNTKRGITER